MERIDEFFEKHYTEYVCDWKGTYSGCTCPEVCFDIDDFKEHLKKHVEMESYNLFKIIDRNSGIYNIHKDYFDSLKVIL